MFTHESILFPCYSTVPRPKWVLLLYYYELKAAENLLFPEELSTFETQQVAASRQLEAAQAEAAQAEAVQADVVEVGPQDEQVDRAEVVTPEVASTSSGLSVVSGLILNL